MTSEKPLPRGHHIIDFGIGFPIKQINTEYFVLVKSGESERLIKIEINEARQFYLEPIQELTDLIPPDKRLELFKQFKNYLTYLPF